MAFRFKHFTVEDGESTMPVGTDAMLLGAWADPGEARSILDVGTGCGILALMMAQKSFAHIEGVDIDPGSVAEAAGNFRSSPWSDRLHATQASLSELAARESGKFDLVISNPPFFSGSLRSPHHRRNIARHDSGMDLPGLVSGVSKLLSDTGRFFVIIPTRNRTRLIVLASDVGLFPFGFLSVRPVESKDVTRLLVGFSRTRDHRPEERSLTICGMDGNFTAEYLDLTRNFHYF